MNPLGLFVALGALSGISIQDLTIFQPESVTVTAGGAVTLQCSYNSSEGSGIGGYRWFYTETTVSPKVEVSNTTLKFHERVFRPDQAAFSSNQRADVEIRGVQHKDVGTYVCEVELFTVEERGRGNGTRLLVLEDEKNYPKPPGQGDWTALWTPVYVGAGVASLLLASIVLTLCLRCRSRGRRRAEMRSSVYETVPEQGKKGRRLQPTNPKQKEDEDPIQYATLSLKDGKKKPQSRQKPESVVYSRIRSDAAQAEGSTRPAENPDHVVYTRVTTGPGAGPAGRTREKPDSVIYAKVPLNA